MSDAGRKDLSDKIGSAIKPDSQKTTTEKYSDKASDKLDNAAGHSQPESEKGPIQKVADAVFGDSNKKA
ncbi:uncharacterized protein KQ657_003983 [Scheffersomyces spartinae]|uniref:Heat shock protein 9/12 n=1 Tax=Scheffersomyces spartinae TaxID=45513 RepID=A0A9P7VBW1_9ASCO|nr:uncharacterized protein KQ657_003983 [Scheffersomyces spartinae]KAG7194875.1 hypothetical protein KQ657_003983 [Scheffersomyces spartinae]